MPTSLTGLNCKPNNSASAINVHMIFCRKGKTITIHNHNALDAHVGKDAREKMRAAASLSAQKMAGDYRCLGGAAPMYSFPILYA